MAKGRGGKLYLNMKAHSLTWEMFFSPSISCHSQLISQLQNNSGKNHSERLLSSKNLGTTEHMHVSGYLHANMSVFIRSYLNLPDRSL